MHLPAEPPGWSPLSCDCLSVPSPDTKTQQLSVLHVHCVAVCLLREGMLDVTKDGLKLLTLEPQDTFGELALPFYCTHNYSVSGIKLLRWPLCFGFVSLDICRPENSGRVLLDTNYF